MDHSEKVEDINSLEQVLDMMRQEIENVQNQAEQAEETAPEAAEEIIDKLDSATNYWEESTERLQNAKERLNDFLTKAKIARDLFDVAQDDPSSRNEDKAERARDRVERAYEKLERAIAKTRAKIAKTDKLITSAQSKLKITLIKVQAEDDLHDDKKVRINFTLPEYMKDDWKSMADDLSTSVSQMIREAMSLYTSELKQAGGNLERGLTKFGAKMEQVGKKVEDYVQKNVQHRYDPETGELKTLKIGGQEVFNDKLTKGLKNIKIPDIPQAPVIKFSGNKGTQKKDKLKKRITGLIKIQKALPIDKLAHSLEVSTEQAENIIYELVAEGMEGNFKNGTFKYTCTDDEAIEMLHAVIDRL